MPSFDLPPINSEATGGIVNNPIMAQNDQPQPVNGGVPTFTAPPMATNPQYLQDSTSVQNVASPAVANDIELMEKEWANRVREINQATNGDPYEKSRQLALLKGEYLQKRYQKTLKST